MWADSKVGMARSARSENLVNKAARWTIEVAISALAGVAAFIAPDMLAPPQAWPNAPLFPIVREAVEHPRLGSFIALGVVGLLGGLFAHTHWALASIHEKLEDTASAIAEYELYLKATKWHSDVYPWRIPLAKK